MLRRLEKRIYIPLPDASARRQLFRLCLRSLELESDLREALALPDAEDGYSGVEVRVTPTRTEIIILATKTQQVLGEKGRRIRELTSVVQKRFNFDDDTVEV